MMKRFILKFLLFVSPFLIMVLLLVFLDIFKVFRSYDDYYTGNFVTLNREMICTKTYQKNRASQHFNSFIFGNSRSQAYKCMFWKNYLESDAVPFHFDASGEGTYGVANKVRYIDEMGDTIKNALIVVDRELLSVHANRESHLFISPPCLSRQSAFSYYTTFLRASVDPKFLAAYVDYSLFHKYRSYMRLLIHDSKYPFEANNTNCDLFYGYEKHIKEDSIGYYSELMKRGVFYQRPYTRNHDSYLDAAETEQLTSIQKVFAKHHTKYKIIISPMYDQLKMESQHLQLLYKLFGKENVYDFSGENKLTDPIGNYYESDHYRPHVANQVLDIVYGRKQMSEIAK